MEEVNVLSKYQEQVFQKIRVVSKLFTTSESRGKAVGEIIAVYEFITDFGTTTSLTVEELDNKAEQFRTLRKLLIDEDTK